MQKALHPYHKFLVPQELVPLREAAIEGDFDAMFELADSLLHGRKMKRCSDSAWQVIDQLWEHPELIGHNERFCNLCIMMVALFCLRYEEGKCSYMAFVQHGSSYYETMVQMMTQTPVDRWNLFQLRRAIEWLEIYPQTSEEELT